MQRIAAFALFAIAHRAASALVEWAIPDGWNEAINFSKGIGVLFLVLVEFFLGWDMLAVFWPRLQMKSDEISI